MGQSVAERAEVIFRSDLTRVEVNNFLQDTAMGIRIAAAICGVESGHLQSKEAADILKFEKPRRSLLTPPIPPPLPVTKPGTASWPNRSGRYAPISAPPLAQMKAAKYTSLPSTP